MARDIGNAWHGIDPFSSGWWFDGWSDWLATTGWRRHGAIGITESPAEHMPRYRRETSGTKK